MFGLVASLNRPGGNVTGITLVAQETVAMRLGLLLELVPAAGVIGLLANPSNPITKPQVTELETAVRSFGRELHILNASSEGDIEKSFAVVQQQHIQALIVAADSFFDDRRAEIVALAARYRIPASYVRREFVAAGGLMSYGPDVPDAFRWAGVYTGRILRGDMPANLPVQEPTKFELVVNVKTAKALGITVPSSLLARAGKVIE